MDVSCLLLSLHGFVSWVCWQPPFGAQTFKSVFCHGLSSFCYARVTTTLLFPLRSSPCWLRASSSLLPFKLHSVTAFPTPVLNLGIPPSGNTSPNPTRELGLASPRRALLHGTVHTQHAPPLGCQWLSRGVGLEDAEDTSPSVHSILCIHWGTRVVFQLRKFWYVYLTVLALASPWVCRQLSLSQCLQECHRAKPAFLDFHTAACGCFRCLTQCCLMVWIEAHTLASMCYESVPAPPQPGHEGGILAERLAFLPHPHPWPCMSHPLLSCDCTGVGGEPALDFLPSCRISPPWGRHFPS